MTFFHTSVSWLFFLWMMSDIRSPQVSRTLLSIMADLNNAVIYIIIITHLSFSHQRKLMVFYWRLSDSKSLQVSRTLFSMLAVFNNAVVWMVFTRPPTSKSSTPFYNPLAAVPKAPIRIDIIVTFIFFQFSLTRWRYLFVFSHYFSFILWSAGTAKSTLLKIFIVWPIFISKSHRSLCVSFSRKGAGLYLHHLLAWSNLNF